MNHDEPWDLGATLPVPCHAILGIDDGDQVVAPEVAPRGQP